MSRRYKKNGVEVTTALNKNKKYKYDASGDLVESVGTPGVNEIVMSGSKSSLRRMADMERNIAILATTLTTTDDGTADSDAASFNSNVNKKTRFKKEVRFEETLNVRDGIDMNSNKITELTTPTAASDAANKSYVDAREAAAEATASADATSKANAAQSAAATDATTKANAANSAADATASADATAKANSAQSNAISTASADATAKANAAQSAAISSANSTSNAYTNTAVSNLVNGASAAFNTLSEIQNAMATDAELSAAINGLTIGNGTVTMSAGSGLTGGGAFSMNQTNSETVTMNVGGGNGLTVSADGIAMSGSFTGNFTATGDVTAYSDDTLKSNVQVIDNALSRVEAVRGVTFDRIADGSSSTGVIAQELLAVLPEAVHTDANGVHSVAYGNITGLLIEAVKELSAEVKSMK